MAALMAREDSGLAGGLDVWNEVLASVSKKKDVNQTLIILGDVGSGKTKLKEKMRGEMSTEDDEDGVMSGVSLEFDYVDIRDPKNPNGDVMSRIDVWTVNGNDRNAEIVSSVLTPSLTHVEQDGAADATDTADATGPSPRLKPRAMALICVDLAQLWNGPESIDKWSQALQNVISHSVSDDLELLDQLRNSQELYYKGFQVSDGFKETVDDEKIQACKTDKGVLEVNTGVPVLIVATKSDTLDTKHLDLLQQRLRQCALKYGAGLVYVSSEWREESVGLVMEYVGHRLYDFDYTMAEEVVSSDQIFVPFGWDTPSKTQSVYQSDKRFDQVFPAPSAPAPSSGKENIVMPTDHQSFLSGLKDGKQELTSSASGKNFASMDSKTNMSSLSSGQPVQSKAAIKAKSRAKAKDTVTEASEFYGKIGKASKKGKKHGF